MTATMRMSSRAMLVGLLVLGSFGAVAQTPPPKAAPATVVLETTPTPQQAAQALAVLTNDARRAEMISVLQTLAHAGPAVGEPSTKVPVTTIPAPGAPGGSVAVAIVPVTGAAAVTTVPVTAVPAAAAGTVPGTAPGAVAAAAAAPKIGIPLAPDSLGADLLVGASDRLEVLSAEVGGTIRALTNFTLLERWAKALAEDPDSRAELLDAAWKLLVVGGLSIGAEAGTKRLIRRPRRALLHSAPTTPTPPEPQPKSAAVPSSLPPGASKASAMKRQRQDARAIGTFRLLPLVAARLLLDLVPVVAMGTVGYGLLGTRLGQPSLTKLVILALLNAYLASRVLTVATRAILAPDAPGLRLLPIDEHLGWTGLRWMRRLAVVALFGYAMTEVALLFGLYRVAHDALLKLVGLVVHLMLVMIVIRCRAPVARLIHTDPERTGFFAAMRNRLAPIWHIIVIFYIVALWLVWALDVPGGFRKLLLVFLSTLVVAGAARLLGALLIAWLDHAVMGDPDGPPRAPGLDHTIHRYGPLLRGSVKVLVGIAALILLLQIWGVDSLDWFRGDALGARLVSATANSFITIAVGLLIWEASNAAVQNHLARLARDGHPARSARLRTLLPMLRTTLLVSISLFVGLTILSQIGVNIAPLLAGAGVVGLAIGFGSQKLVQDIITGLFLLLENTMQVGDVVTLASLTGTVENLSIRTIRLRALDGAVHIVPFSAVTTVTNLTRDFAYAMLDISVGLNEEPDAVADIVQDVAETMRKEARWGAAITEGMEVMGVERFIDTAWVLRCRLKTVPSQRWAVARELNRRIKYRFDEMAIESPFTSYKALSLAAPAPPNAKTEEPGQAAA